ncbi:hypothetical protein VE02_05099 [Pseudogymnoascus sp. 03VT05]|nr:hypothetical protein VE02_05099 [Pseudogymnoascus sp. 03VT05]
MSRLIKPLPNVPVTGMQIYARSMGMASHETVPTGFQTSTFNPWNTFMADKDRADHHTAGSPEFLPTIKALMSNLSDHIKEGEEQVLPALDSKLSAEDSSSMAKSFSRTKAFVPSRSHPSAPNKPPFETAVGLLAAPIDHLADLFRKFPDETVSPNPSTK